jgi:hypothetical protein
MAKKILKPATPKRLTDTHLGKILTSLDEWRGPLTWDRLIDVVYTITGHRYTRQGLYVHEMIRTAFVFKKANLEAFDNPPIRGSVAVKEAKVRIEKLELQVERLKFQNNSLIAQFERFINNALAQGWNPDLLNRPLRTIDREATRANPEET